MIPARTGSMDDRGAQLFFTTVLLVKHISSVCYTMASVFFPDAARLQKLGYTSVAHVPALFDSQEKYCRAHSWYLRDRATLKWIPKGSKKNGVACRPFTSKHRL